MEGGNSYCFRILIGQPRYIPCALVISTRNLLKSMRHIDHDSRNMSSAAPSSESSSVPSAAQPAEAKAPLPEAPKAVADGDDSDELIEVETIPIESLSTTQIDTLKRLSARGTFEPRSSPLPLHPRSCPAHPCSLLFFPLRFPQFSNSMIRSRAPCRPKRASRRPPSPAVGRERNWGRDTE